MRPLLWSISGRHVFVWLFGGGSQLLNLLGCWLDDYASKVASILLLCIGSKMIYDVVVEDVDEVGQAILPTG